MTRRWRHAGAATLSFALLAAACGGGDEDASGATAPDAATDTGGAVAEAEPILPAVDVVDLHTGETVALTSLTDDAAGRPILLWFWAPF